MTISANRLDVLRLVLVLFTSQLLALAALAAETLPYLGHWSNGRGETLAITKKKIQFGNGDPLPYRDVTRATDGASFELQITARGNVNGLGGKTLAVVCEKDSMKITAYKSHADYMHDENPQSVVTWYKDSD